MSVTVEQVNEALKGIVDPNTHKDLVAGRAARNVRVEGADVAVDPELGYPAPHPIAPFPGPVVAALRALPGVSNVSAHVHHKNLAHAAHRRAKTPPGVQEIPAPPPSKGDQAGRGSVATPPAPAPPGQLALAPSSPAVRHAAGSMADAIAP